MTNETRNQLYADLHALRTQDEIGENSRSRLQHLLDNCKLGLLKGEGVIFDRLSTQDAVLYAIIKLGGK